MYLKGTDVNLNMRLVLYSVSMKMKLTVFPSKAALCNGMVGHEWYR